MNKSLLTIGTITGMLAVVFGAFGAHSLKKLIELDQLAIFHTGVTYQFYHTFAIFIAAWLGNHFNNKLFNRAGWFFFAGIICFSGSLYLLSTRAYLGIESWSNIIGPITPIGGLFFIIGWGTILWGVRKG